MAYSAIGLLKYSIRHSNIKISVDLRPIGRMVNEMTEIGRAHDAVLESMVYRYKQFSYRRFRSLSSGGGEWPPLKRRTRKRYGKGRRVLIDSGTLLASLKATKGKRSMGTYSRPIPGGVQFGFSRTMHMASGLTFERLATIHTKGLGNNPKRVILTEPDDKTLQDMEDDAIKIALRLKKRLGMK